MVVDFAKKYLRNLLADSFGWRKSVGPKVGFVGYSSGSGRTSFSESYLCWSSVWFSTVAGPAPDTFSASTTSTVRIRGMCPAAINRATYCLESAASVVCPGCNMMSSASWACVCSLDS